MSNLLGTALAVAALVGVSTIFLRETSAGKTITKDLNKAESNIRNAANQAQKEANHVVSESTSTVKQVGEDLVHLRMTNTTIAILSGVAAFAAYKLLLCPPRREKDE